MEKPPLRFKYLLISIVGHLILFITLIFAFSSNEPPFIKDNFVITIKPDSFSSEGTRIEYINPSEYFVGKQLILEKTPELPLIDFESPLIRNAAPSESPASQASSIEPRPTGSNKPPVYPRIARQLQQEGLVILVAEIDDKGLVSAIKTIKSSGYKLLDDAASKAVKEWSFIPAAKDGRPIKSFLEISIRFKLT